MLKKKVSNRNIEKNNSNRYVDTRVHTKIWYSNNDKSGGWTERKKGEANSTRQKREEEAGCKVIIP